MYPLKNKLAMYGLYAFIVVAIVSGGWMIYASQQPKKDVARVSVTSVSSFSTRSASASVSSSSSASTSASSSNAPTSISSPSSSLASSESSSSLFSNQIVAPPTRNASSQPTFAPPVSQQPPTSSYSLPPVIVVSSQAVSVAPPASTTPISSSSTPPLPVSSAPPPVSSSSSTAPQPRTFSVIQPYTSPGGPVTVVFSLTTLSSTITGTTTTFQSGDGTSQNYVSTFRNGIFSKVSGKTIAELSSVSVSGASLTSGAFNVALTSFKQQAQ